jgi:ComF family protein
VREALEQLLLPAECLLCRALLSYPQRRRLVCDVCRHRWRPVRPPWCERCGQPEPHFGRCRLCAEWPAALQRARSAVWLDDGARQAVHALKYGGLPRIAEDLGEVMARLAVPERDAWLVPLPLGPARQRARGYNQSERLAHALAQRWDRPVAPLLVRVRETATQTALTPEARLANVAGAFEVRNAECGMRNGPATLGSAFRIPNSALVLVDDVFTTGATLAEAARALERAGARTVVAVTFGRAVIPDFS